MGARPPGAGRQLSHGAVEPSREVLLERDRDLRRAWVAFGKVWAASFERRPPRWLMVTLATIVGSWIATVLVIVALLSAR